MDHNATAFDEALLIFSASDPDMCRHCTESPHHSYSITIPYPDDPTFWVSVSNPGPVPLAWLDRAVIFAGQRRGWAIDALLWQDNVFTANLRCLTLPKETPTIEYEANDIAIARLLTYAAAVRHFNIVEPQFAEP